MTIYEELKARGLIAQVTNEEEISEMINNGKATFYIGFDPTADSLHVGHFMALCLMKRLQMAGNKPIALVGGGVSENMPTTTLTEEDFTDGQIGVLSLLVKCGLAASNGEARKLVQGGGVSLNGEKVADFKQMLDQSAFTEECIIKKGKKTFHKAALG